MIDWLLLVLSLSLYRLREDLNRNLEAAKKKDAPVKKISLNDLVVKVRSLVTFNSCT